MLYVEPVYVRATSENSYPLLRKVLLSYGKFVAYEDTLQAGIDSLIKQATGQAPPQTNNPPPGGTSPPSTGGQSQALTDAANRISQAITDLRAAQQAGDFAKQGQALQALDDAVKAYQAAQQAAGAAAPTTPPSTPPSPSGSTSPNP